MENEPREPIYVAGYPKSGTTWITRLLAQALDSPSGASIPSEDRREPATEGRNRPGSFIVRKGHFVPFVGNGLTAVSQAHRIDRTAEFTAVFLTRDPRDVAISAAHYKGMTVDQVMYGMVHGTLFGMPSWRDYTNAWIGLLLERSRVATVRYEDMVEYPELVLRNLLGSLDLAARDELIERAVTEQSFAAKRAYAEASGDRMIGGRELNLKLLRRGVAGQWRESLSPAQMDYARKHWGRLLCSLGY